MMLLLKYETIKRIWQNDKKAQKQVKKLRLLEIKTIFRIFFIVKALHIFFEIGHSSKT
jgi:hypothetical protein